MNSTNRRATAIFISVTVALVSTVFYIILAYSHRSIEGYPPLPAAAFLDLPLDVWNVGDNLAAIAGMLFLCYLLSLIAPVRRYVTGEMQSGDSIRLAVVWLALFLCAIWLFFLRQDWFGTSVVFVITLSGYLAGWRVGLAAGVLATLVAGTYNMYLYGELDEAWRAGSWAVVLAHWGENALFEHVLSVEASILVWVGLLAGLARDWTGDWIGRPVVAAVVGGVIVLGKGLIEVIFHQEPRWATENLGPEAVAVGIGLAFAVVIVNNMRADAAQRRAAAAELARTQAELLALRAQINPHFLFNSINTIRHFVRVDSISARRLLSDLSDVFQHALTAGDSIPLRDEIHYVEAYLALEAARMGERLRIQWEEIPDAALDIAVPTLILQPLVENAVHHGLAPKQHGGTVTIGGALEDGHLVLRVCDDGVGMDAARLAALPTAPARNLGGQRHSIALHNINGRLASLYGEPYRLQIESQPGVGTVVCIRLPLESTERLTATQPAPTALFDRRDGSA